MLYRFSNASNSTLNSISKVLCQTWGAISISTPNYLAFADTDISVFNSKNPHMGNSVFRDAITIFKSWEKTVHSQLDAAVNQFMSLFIN